MHTWKDARLQNTEVKTSSGCVKRPVSDIPTWWRHGGETDADSVLTFDQGNDPSSSDFRMMSQATTVKGSRKCPRLHKYTQKKKEEEEKASNVSSYWLSASNLSPVPSLSERGWSGKSSSQPRHRHRAVSCWLPSLNHGFLSTYPPIWRFSWALCSALVPVWSPSPPSRPRCCSLRTWAPPSAPGKPPGRSRRSPLRDRRWLGRAFLGVRGNRGRDCCQPAPESWTWCRMIMGSQACCWGSWSSWRWGRLEHQNLTPAEKEIDNDMI